MCRCSELSPMMVASGGTLKLLSAHVAICDGRLIVARAYALKFISPPPYPKHFEESRQSDIIAL